MSWNSHVFDTQLFFRDKRCSLSEIYFAVKVIIYLREIYVVRKWLKFRNLCPPIKQTMEQAVILMAQWCQPYELVFRSDIEALLDSIVQQILKVLNDVHPTHSIFAISEEEFSFWQHNNVNCSLWDKEEAEQIMNTVCTVIFHELDFHESDENAEGRYMHVENFFIDKVAHYKLYQVTMIFKSLYVLYLIFDFYDTGFKK